MTNLLRSGLPRTSGGSAWPPPNTPPPVTQSAPEPAPVAAPAPVATSSGEPITLRQGLPRVADGPGWPETTTVTAQAPVTPVTEPNGEPVASVPSTETVQLRQGLPRVADEPAWPTVAQVDVTVEHAAETTVEAPAQTPEPAPAPAATVASPVAPAQEKTPALQPEPKPKKYGHFTMAGWASVAFGTVLGLGVLLAIVVFGTRAFLGTDTGQTFLANYDGHAPMPESAPIGVPGWLAWTHFFNLFFMALIIKSGIQIRYERRTGAYWTPRGGGKKISLTVWLHQSLDVLWVVNGLIFIALLFATGQWMKIVPTSWEVLPHALSAGLQYLSLDWPTENGWVHYNGLQQITYFLVVFVAAPIAVVTGVRMSEFWTKAPVSWSKAYPVELARKLHFPTMLFFSVFIIMHVALVFATGALRNLNHMFAAQGSVDPAEYASNWTGFLIFLAAMVFCVAAIAAARPMVLTPIARVFGDVTAR